MIIHVIRSNRRTATVSSDKVLERPTRVRHRSRRIVVANVRPIRRSQHRTTRLDDYNRIHETAVGGLDTVHYYCHPFPYIKARVSESRVEQVDSALTTAAAIGPIRLETRRVHRAAGEIVGRSTRYRIATPGRAPVCSPLRTTNSPLTST